MIETGILESYYEYIEEEIKKENNDDRTEVINSIENKKENKINLEEENKLIVAPTTITDNKKREPNLQKLNIDNNINNNKNNEILILRKKRGRKKNENTDGESKEKEHNKYSDDNIRRKIKHIILKNILDFINKKIEIIDTNINRGIFTKKLMTIQQRQISNATILFNKKFLYKKLKDIFSVDISKRYTNYLPEHNKNLITSLINDEDCIKSDYFKGLFDLSFLDCLEHFRGSKHNYYLKGLDNFEEEMNKLGEKDYINTVRTYMYHYENIINNKKERICLNEDE